VAATSSTLYWIASITKTVTALLAAQLVEAGSLDLDRDVAAYLGWQVRNPAFPSIPITPRLLMTHTSSIHDGSIWSNLLSYKGGDPVVTLAEAAPEYFTPGGRFYQPMNFGSYPPGGNYTYSNIAVALLGHICEVIAGEAYVPLAARRVLAPLGMDRSFWYYSDLPRLGLSLRPDVAMPYSYKNFSRSSWPPSHKPVEAGILLPQGFYGYPDVPAGMLRTSAAQLSRIGALMGCGGSLGGTRLLQADTVAQMLTKQATADDDEEQGLIFYRSSSGSAATRGRPLWGHNGGDLGASTDLFFTEDGAVGLAVLTNGEAYGAQAAIADGKSELETQLFAFAWTLPVPAKACT